MREAPELHPQQEATVASCCATDPLVDIEYEGRLEAVGIPLSEAIPTNSDPVGYAEARRDLLSIGEHHCGGGAAPHFILRYRSE